MDSKKYIGMDVHQASISVAVRDGAGKLVMECIIETKAATVLEFTRGLRGNLWIAFEEGTSAAWLYDLLKPHAAQVVVCDPRKNALLKAGNKNDRVDARKLSELLRAGLLTPVYHGDSGVRTLRELSRSYLTVTKDLTRVMNRLKALYRSWAIACAGEKVYSPRHRSSWLEQLSEAGVRRRAEQLYQQLDALVQIRRQARRELLTESQKHPANQLLRQIPLLGPIRVALLIALLQTPHRFRTKRQLWAYAGLALQTRISGEYRFTGGQLQSSKRLPALRGLNHNHSHDLKNVFKSAAKNRKRIQRLMRILGIEAHYPKPNLSRPAPGHEVYPYLLRGVEILRPNHVWSTDITDLPMRGGFLYLVAVMDWFSRFVLSWELSNTMETGFCLTALDAVFRFGQPEIWNSDQGSQFTSADFLAPLKSRGIAISMDGRGRALDNVFIERLWRSLKYELIYPGDFATGLELFPALESYFHFYNHQRPHQALGYRTPADLFPHRLRRKTSSS